MSKQEDTIKTVIVVDNFLHFIDFDSGGSGFTS